MLVRSVLLIMSVLLLFSCSKERTEYTDDDQIYSKTYGPNGELIGFNMLLTACDPTATTGNLYSCSVDTSGGEEFLYMDTANTCTWASADITTFAITGTPATADIGTCDLVFTRVDLTSSFTTFTFSVVVSGAGGFAIGDTSLNEDSALTEIRGDFDVSAPSEGGSGEYSFDNAAAASPKCADNGILSIHENNGAIEFYPYPNYEGICNVAVDFTDGPVIDSTSFQVTVNQVNDTPEINFICADEVLQDSALSVTPNFIDIDGDILTWIAGPSTTCPWSSVNPSTGEITGTPADDEVGACTISLVANDGTINSSEFIKSIIVENVRPTLSIADQTIDPSGGAVIIGDAIVQSNEESFGTYSISATAPGVACTDHGNTVVINSTTGEITYTPNPSFEFICHVTVIFNDGNTSRNIVEASFAVTTLQNPAPVQNLMIAASAISSLTASPVISWDPPATFFDHYEIALGTAPGLDDLVGWTDIGYNVTHSFSGLTLNQCDLNYVTVKAVDVVGNDSSFEGVNFYGDTIAPAIPTITALGTERHLPDGDANSTTWTAFDNCNLGHHQVAIGTTTSTDDIISWTDNSLLTNHQFTGFTGATFNRTDAYYNLVQSFDEAGNDSAIAFVGTWMFPEFTFRRDITFANATPANEFQIEVTLTPSNFDDSMLQDDGDDIRFYDNSDTLLEYHLIEFIEGEIARFIVKIPASATTGIYVAYENPLSTYGGSEDALNSSFIRDLYARISSNANNALSAYTYIDSNEIQINGVTNYVLASQYDGVVTALSNTHSIVGARGPISARVVSNNNDHDILPAISLAATEFVNSYTRVTERYEFYNPNSTAATVDIFDFSTGGVAALSTTINVPATSFVSQVFNTTIGIIESDIPVVAFTRGGNDAVQLFETSTDIFGIPSNIGTVAFTVNGTTGTIYWSDGTSDPISGNRGQQVTLPASGNQMTGRGYRIITDEPIAARQTADSDGSEASSSVPRSKLDKKYIIPKTSQYIAIICHIPGSTITLDDAGAIEVQVCPATATNPGKLFFGSASVVTYGAGTIVESDSTFFAAWENSNQQETNVLGPSSGIPYAENPITPSIGAQSNN